MKKCPHFFKAYKKLRSEKSSTDGFIISLLGSARSSFRDSGSYPGFAVGLDEEDVQLII